MGNKPSNPGNSEPEQGYVPEVNKNESNINNNGELNLEKMQRMANKINRSAAIEILKMKNPRLMASGNKKEIEDAIEETIESIKQDSSVNTNAEINKLKARMEELKAAPNNATRAKIKERHEAENHEELRAKMSSEELELNDKIQSMVNKAKAGGRRHYKKTRKHRNKARPKYKKTKSRRRS